LTPPKGGPFCVENCVGYSYTDISAYIVLVGGFALVILLFVVFSIAYGFDVEYRFEVAAIAVDWTVIIVVGTLLALAYWSDTNNPQ
jgi:hypothetical protein